MSIGSIDSESTQLGTFEAFTPGLIEKPTPDWNGYCVNKAHLGQPEREIRDLFLCHVIANPRLLSVYKSDFFLCGNNVDGEVAVRGSADSKGNKSAEVEVTVSSKDESISGSVSGGISQDKDGHTESKVQAEVKMSF